MEFPQMRFAINLVCFVMIASLFEESLSHMWSNDHNKYT